MCTSFTGYVDATDNRGVFMKQNKVKKAGWHRAKKS